MSHKTVIDLLLAERNRVLAEKEAMSKQFDTKIFEIEASIQELSGGKAWEISNEVRFDDEHPDYIKQSAEEI